MHGIWRNALRADAAARSLAVRVLDANGHATRAGAEVRVFAAGTRRLLGVRMVDTGSGYNAQNDLPVHFGIPARGAVDVEVTWPARGVRAVTAVRNVEPAAFKGKVLTVRAK